MRRGEVNMFEKSPITLEDTITLAQLPKIHAL